MVKLFSWGANSHGQLSFGYKNEQCSVPQEIECNLSDGSIQMICGGGGHVLMLYSNGSIYSCGWNDKGQLGMQLSENEFKLKRIPAHYFNGNSIRTISCGWNVSAAVCTNGIAYSWGSNMHEQLGVPKNKLQYSYEPIVLQLPQNEAIKDVQFNLRNTCVLCENGFVYIFGKGRYTDKLKNNSNFQLINYNTMNFWLLTEQSKLISGGQNHIVTVSNTGIVSGYGEDKFSQSISVNFNGKYIESIKSGWTHNGALLSNGELFLWGRNNYGQVGINPKNSGNIIASPFLLKVPGKIQQFHLGAEHGIAITNTGHLFIWGWNEHGNCGNGSTENVYDPIKVNLLGKCIVGGCGAGYCYAVFVD